jgi:hypothetical protein
MNTTQNSLAGKTILDRKGLAPRVGLTPRQVKTLSDERKIPFLNLGHRTKRYALEDVLEALAKFEVKAVA